jgi:hypothetical protein
MATGNLVLARAQEYEEQFNLFLVDFGEGRILKVYLGLTEPDAREVLSENFGESES